MKKGKRSLRLLVVALLGVVLVAVTLVVTIGFGATSKTTVTQRLAMHISQLERYTGATGLNASHPLSSDLLDSCMTSSYERNVWTKTQVLSDSLISDGAVCVDSGGSFVVDADASCEVLGGLAFTGGLIVDSITQPHADTTLVWIAGVAFHMLPRP